MARHGLGWAQVAALALLIAVACGLGRMASPHPHLIDRLDHNGDVRSGAPVVVVGVLQSDRAVARPIATRSRPEGFLQLRRLVIRVENVLQGAPQPDMIGAYYFTWAGGFDGPRPLGFWEIGGRRILWLTWDSGVLRTVCDGWDICTMGVQSGSHLRYRPQPQKPVGQAVADILLTRGEGTVHDLRFARQISWGVPGQGLEAYVVEKLRHLAGSESGGVKAAACDLLWVYTVDRIDERIRQDAKDALHQADCLCSVQSGGNVVCQ